MQHQICLVSSLDSAGALSDILGEHFYVIPCKSPADVQETLSTSNCGVVVGTGEEMLAALSEFAALHRCPPCVAIDRHEPPKPISPFIFDRIRPGEVTDELLSVVVRAVIEDILQRGMLAARKLIRRGGTGVRLGLALEAAFSRRVRSVAGLARASGRSERTIQARWKNMKPVDTAFGLKDMLLAIQVLDSIDAYLRDPGATWREVARRSGVSERTNRRAFHLLVGCPPTDLRVRDLPEIIHRIEVGLQPVLALVRESRGL